MTSSNNNTAFDFERSLAELESIVQQLESSDLSLEASLKAFEQGVVLTRSCQQALSQAEQRVQLLTEEQGQSRVQPFERDHDGGPF
jgi:exodeoxyribonuclease VII small subunit